MESKHTAGPFAIFLGPDGNIHRGNGSFSREELHTINAAPDLLEACKALVAWNKCYPSNHIYSHGEILKIAKEIDNISEAAVAAIAKAERTEQ